VDEEGWIRDGTVVDWRKPGTLRSAAEPAFATPGPHREMTFIPDSLAFDLDISIVGELGRRCVAGGLGGRR
jgi:hypothetical protein